MPRPLGMKINGHLNGNPLAMKHGNSFIYKPPMSWCFRAPTKKMDNFGVDPIALTSDDLASSMLIIAYCETLDTLLMSVSMVVATVRNTLHYGLELVHTWGMESLRWLRSPFCEKRFALIEFQKNPAYHVWRRTRSREPNNLPKFTERYDPVLVLSDPKCLVGPVWFSSGSVFELAGRTFLLAGVCSRIYMNTTLWNRYE